MREREMRQRVERFLQSRLRSMVMPATLGLGLALAGCDSDGLNASDNKGIDGGVDGGVDGGQSENTDVGSAQLAPDSRLNDAGGSDVGGYKMLYMAQMPDASTAPSDSGMVLRYMAQMPQDARTNADERFAMLYCAQIPVSRP